MAEYILVTNNQKCFDKYEPLLTVEFSETWTYLEVLLRARDLIHNGLTLVTHPMAGSLKPNQTPYRSVVLSDTTLEDKSPYDDVIMIENSISNCQKWLRNRPLPPLYDFIKNDFRTLDLSFIESAMQRTLSHA